MIFGPIISAIILALAFTVVFTLLLNNRGPWGAGIFFLILFFVMWAGGLWLQPMPPYFWGVSWVPLFFIGLAIALLISAATPVQRKKPKSNPESNPPNPRDGEKKSVFMVDEEQQEGAIAISIFFWALMIVLIIAIVAGYLFSS